MIVTFLVVKHTVAVWTQGSISQHLTTVAIKATAQCDLATLAAVRKSFFLFPFFFFFVQLNVDRAQLTKCFPMKLP